MITFETRERSEVDSCLKAVEEMVGRDDGPVATRHIVNPSCNKDEGMRLIWRSKPSQIAPERTTVKTDALTETEPGEMREEGISESDEASKSRDKGRERQQTSGGDEVEIADSEMADWPRRDQLIREGKTVRSSTEIRRRAHSGGLWVPPMLHLSQWGMATLSPFSPIPGAPFVEVPNGLAQGGFHITPTDPLVEGGTGDYFSARPGV